MPNSSRKVELFHCLWAMLLLLYNEERAGLIIAIIIWSDLIRKTEGYKNYKKTTKKGIINFLNKKDIHPLLFLSTLREWIFPWGLSWKLITRAWCVTLTILAKTPRKVNKYFPFNMSNLSEKSSTLQTFFNKNVKTETVSN